MIVKRAQINFLLRGLRQRAAREISDPRSDKRLEVMNGISIASSIEIFPLRVLSSPGERGI